MPHHHAYHPSTGFKEDSEIFVYWINSVSLVGSAAILLTIIMFPDFYNRQLYVKILSCLALSDLVRAIAGLFGYPTTSDLCYAQGVLWSASIYAGIGWTTLLSITVYNQIRFGKIYIKYWPWMHVIVWPGSILLAFGPLMSGNLEYGTLAEGGDSCVLRTRDNINDDGNRSEEIQTRELLTWIFIGKIGVYFTCLLIMTLMPLILKYSFIPKLKDAKGVVFATRTEQLVDTVLLYPLGMVIAWLPATVCVVAIAALQIKDHTAEEHNIALDAFFVTYLWGSFYGFYTAIVFFANSSEVRHRWSKFIKRYIICQELQNDAMIGLEEELAAMSAKERLMVNDEAVGEDLEALKEIHEQELRQSQWTKAKRMTKRLSRRFTKGLDDLNVGLGLNSKGDQNYESDSDDDHDDTSNNDNDGSESNESGSVKGVVLELLDTIPPLASTNNDNTNPIHDEV